MVLLFCSITLSNKHWLHDDTLKQKACLLFNLETLPPLNPSQSADSFIFTLYVLMGVYDKN